MENGSLHLDHLHQTGGLVLHLHKPLYRLLAHADADQALQIPTVELRRSETEERLPIVDSPGKNSEG
jgi:hypothetical protein